MVMILPIVPKAAETAPSFAAEIRKSPASNGRWKGREKSGLIRAQRIESGLLAEEFAPAFREHIEANRPGGASMRHPGVDRGPIEHLVAWRINDGRASSCLSLVEG